MTPVLPFIRFQMQQDGRRVAQCTTAVFDGMIAMTRPEDSWVAKWQRIGECKGLDGQMATK